MRVLTKTKEKYSKGKIFTFNIGEKENEETKQIFNLIETRLSSLP